MARADGGSHRAQPTPRSVAAPASRILGRVSKRSVVVVAGAVVLGGIAAFWLLDVVLAAALVALVGTLAAIGVLASGWESHPTFDDRERARARSRKERWVKNADVRARDRARWEAYQARQAEKARQAEQSGPPGTPS
jgi:hypothetical protein